MFSLAFSTAACGSGPATLTPDVVAGVRSTKVTSYISQERLTVQAGVDHTLMGFGLVGVAASFALGERQAEAAASRVHDAAKDVDFRGQFWAVVPSVATQVPWLKTVEPKTSPASFKLITASRVADASALILTTNYSLSPGCQKFVTATTIRFYLQGQPEAEAAVSTIWYFSTDIGSKNTDQAISLWTADNGAAYRKAVTESIAESAKMLRYALATMGGNPPKARRQVNLKKELMYVSIIEETEERILYQQSDGQIVSAAAKDMEFDSYESLYAWNLKLEEKERERKRVLEEQKAWEDSDPAGSKHWKTWTEAHPSDACVSALASLRSASECVGAACSEPLLLTAGYYKKCQPDPETRIEVHNLRRKWQKETSSGASN